MPDSEAVSVLSESEMVTFESDRSKSDSDPPRVLLLSELIVALWLYTILIILTKQTFSVGCVMVLALQLTHNSRSCIGYQTVTNAHKNKGLKGSNSLL